MATTTKNVAYPHGSILIFLPHICLAAPLFFFNLISKYCVSKVNVVSVILDYLGFVFFFFAALIKEKKKMRREQMQVFLDIILWLIFVIP